MALAPGARIGPYEIVSLLGAGGMGEVYRATDHTLVRDVAIKSKGPATEDRVDGAPASLVVVLNWTEELKQRVPVK
jgi:hypothetical protein